MLLLTVLAFAVDQRVWLAGPPLLVAAARTAWLAYVRRRASRSYVRRLLTERHEVRFDAWRRLERSRRSTAWVSFTIAGMFAFTCLTDVSAHMAPGSPASPPVDRDSDARDYGHRQGEARQVAWTAGTSHLTASVGSFERVRLQSADHDHIPQTPRPNRPPRAPLVPWR